MYPHLTMYPNDLSHLVDMGIDGGGRSTSGQSRVEWDATTAQEQLALLMDDEVFEKASPEVAFDMVLTHPLEPLLLFLNTPCQHCDILAYLLTYLVNFLMYSSPSYETPSHDTLS